jgi:GAF domain-containing protein
MLSQLLNIFSMKHEPPIIKLNKIQEETQKLSGELRALSHLTDILNDRDEELRNLKNKLEKNNSILVSVARISSVLITSNNWETQFNYILEELGKSVKVDRTYLFKNFKEDGELYCKQLAEWTSIDSCVKPQIDNQKLQKVKWSSLPIFYEHLSVNHILCGIVDQIFEHDSAEYEILKEQQIKSICCVPIYSNHYFWGFMGFDDCTNDRNWSYEEEQILSTAAEIIGGVIYQQYRYEKDCAPILLT